MRTLLTAVVFAALAQGGERPSVEHLIFDIEGGGEMPYAVSVPPSYDGSVSSPLILALHPGGKQGSYYGSRNMRQIFEPALRDWNAIVVAPEGHREATHATANSPRAWYM